MSKKTSSITIDHLPKAPESTSGPDLSRLSTVLDDFLVTVDALRDFVDTTHSVLNKQQANFKPDKSEVSGMALLTLLMTEALGENAPPLEDRARSKLERLVGGNVEIVRNGQSVTVVNVHPHVAKSLSKVSRRISSSTAKHSILFRSTLISLCSASEVVVARVVQHRFTRHPGSIGADAAILLKDFVQCGGIEEACARIAEDRAEDILRGSFEDWLDHLTKKAGLKAPAAVARLARISEVFQRRHLCIHNGGIVNRRYRQRLHAGAAGPTPSLGERLEITREYADSATELLGSVFSTIIAEYGQSTDEAKALESRIVARAMDALNANRLQEAEVLSEYLATMGSDESIRMIGKIDSWECRKRQGRFGEVKDAIVAADFSALDHRFEIARYGLLEDRDAVVGAAVGAFRSGDMSPEDFDAWPVLAGVRRSTKVRRMLREYRKSESGGAPSADEAPDSAAIVVQKSPLSARARSSESVRGQRVRKTGG